MVDLDIDNGIENSEFMICFTEHLIGQGYPGQYLFLERGPLHKYCYVENKDVLSLMCGKFIAIGGLARSEAVEDDDRFLKSYCLEVLKNQTIGNISNFFDKRRTEGT